MNQRPLGQTGMTVSEIGYGTWGIGGDWGTTHDHESIAALNEAIELGLTFIDTAWNYGQGHAERLVGQVVRGRTERVYVASKIPAKNHTYPARHDVPVAEVYPARQIREYTEASLRNLGLERIDLQQLHAWSPTWLDDGDWLGEIGRLKAEGKIGAFGVSINDHQPETALSLVRSGHVDVIELIYNVFDQSPEDELLPACQEHGVGVIVRVPLDEGGLTGTITPDTIFEAEDWRTMYFGGDRKQQVAERVDAIVDDLGITTDQLPETALRYVLSHPAVSTVVPGMRTIGRVRQNMAVGDGRGLSADQVAALTRHRWVRNFYQPADQGVR